MHVILQKVKFGMAVALLAASLQANGMTYQELSKLADSVSMRDCPRIDIIVDDIERHLKARRLWNVRPENLNPSDREYNALARIIIWNLRIGCSNPR